MNEKITNLKNILLKPKVLTIGGIVAMVLIMFSSWGTSKEKKPVEKAVFDSETYRQTLEENVRQIVGGITGDQNATVVVTLESGVKYHYADDKKSDKSTSGGTENRKETDSQSTQTITVRGSDGGEQALLVTEWMPEVRGVAVICRNGDHEEIAEKITNAVTSAFHITSQRVYIAGGTNNEKR